MMRLKNGKFFFDNKVIRKDPVSNLKDLWFRESACAKIYAHWLETLQDASLAAIAEWCRAAHAINADKLHARIVQLGEDVHLLDSWRSFASLKDILATSFGQDLAVHDVTVMERDLLEEYMAKLMNFDNENLELVQHELLPIQHKCAAAWVPPEAEQSL